MYHETRASQNISTGRFHALDQSTCELLHELQSFLFISINAKHQKKQKLSFFDVQLMPGSCLGQSTIVLKNFQELFKCKGTGFKWGKFRPRWYFFKKSSENTSNSKIWSRWMSCDIFRVSMAQKLKSLIFYLIFSDFHWQLANVDIVQRENECSTGHKQANLH